GDVNGDGTLDILTAPGAGGGSLIKVFDSGSGALEQSFDAYDPEQTDGAFVAAGDVNGDGKADIITGTDVGAAPCVKGCSGSDGALLTTFLADPLGPAAGVRVAAGDVNADGFADIITGAGPGSRPRVSVFSGVDNAPLYDFFAYSDHYFGG